MEEAKKAAKAAEVKRKLAEVAEKEKVVVVEAEKLKVAEVKRKVALDLLATKNAEKKARVEQKQA